MWVICEIMGKKVILEVSALPLIWLIWVDEELLCYWPKTNAASKIRSCAEPKSHWPTYRCRLLMNGATFETYNAALEAEQISEGFSTLSAFRDNIAAKSESSDSDNDDDSNDAAVERSASSSSAEDEQTCSSVLLSDDCAKDNIAAKSDSSDSDSDVDFNDDAVERPLSSSSLEDEKSDSSVLLSDDCFTGNDSFEYNKRIKFGGGYISENKKSIGTQLDETTKFPEKKSEVNSPPGSDYSTIFANGAGMLTSTILDSDFIDANQINSKIVKIKGIISSFVANVDHEMELLSQMVQSKSSDRGHMGSATVNQYPYQRNDYTVPNSSKIEILDVEIVNTGTKTTGTTSTNSSPIAFENRFDLIDVEVQDANVAENNTDVSRPIMDTESATKTSNFDVSYPIVDSKIVNAVDIRNVKLTNGNHLDVMNVRHNKNNAHSAAMEVIFTKIPEVYDSNPNNEEIFFPNAWDGSNVRRKENNVHNVMETTTKIPKVSNPNNDEMFLPNAGNTNNDVVNAQVSKPKIYLPINSLDRYKKNEDVFLTEEIRMDASDSPLEKALINHLAPLNRESETVYMERTIAMVFEEKFFLESTSWKTEPRRVNLSVHNNMMRCWRKSFESMFGPDDRFSNFKKHWRRVKQAKRASEKAKTRKLKMLNSKWKR